MTSSATAQRSAQELPLVEKQSTDSYPVIGGKKMVLSGHNFLQDSKVIFVEKAPGTFSRMVGELLLWVLLGTGSWLARYRFSTCMIHLQKDHSTGSHQADSHQLPIGLCRACDCIPFVVLCC